MTTVFDVPPNDTQASSPVHLMGSSDNFVSIERCIHQLSALSSTPACCLLTIQNLEPHFDLINFSPSKLSDWSVFFCIQKKTYNVKLRTSLDLRSSKLSDRFRIACLIHLLGKLNAKGPKAQLWRIESHNSFPSLLIILSRPIPIMSPPSCAHFSCTSRHRIIETRLVIHHFRNSCNLELGPYERDTRICLARVTDIRTVIQHARDIRDCVDAYAATGFVWPPKYVYHLPYPLWYYS